MHYLRPTQTDASLLANNTLLDATFCVRLHTLLHVFACYWAKFETDQTLEPTTPNISFVPWSLKRVAQQCWIRLHCSSNITELTQRRRRWQRERQKSNRFRQAKQQLCTCITLFCTFLCRRCTTATWNGLISRFVEDGNKRQQFSFSLPIIKFANIWRIKRDGISAIKLEAAQIHFLSDVFVAVAVVVA